LVLKLQSKYRGCFFRHSVVSFYIDNTRSKQNAKLYGDRDRYQIIYVTSYTKQSHYVWITSAQFASVDPHNTRSVP